MKKILLSIAVMLAAVGCNDASMDRFPIESQTEVTAFKSNENFKTFSWSLYDAFSNEALYERSLKADGNGGLQYYAGDIKAGYMSTNGVDYKNPYAAQTATVPQTGGGWAFNDIRRVNTMLVNIDKSEMTDAQKIHWRAVGLFFHSFKYVELIMRFGDVPWIENVIEEKDGMAELVRIPRQEAADKVMANLKWAEENINKSIGKDANGKNTINKEVVQALINRFGLWEGTWRKYHQSGGDHASYLQEVVRTGDLLMAAYPAVGSSYDLKFNSESLADYPGTILYKEYSQVALRHWNTGIERSGSGVWQMHKFIVEMFLSSNGLPVKNAANTQYAGDRTMYDECRDRDFRLLLNVIPPYKVKGAGSQGTWSKTNEPKDSEYVDYMEQNTHVGGKRLPVMRGDSPSVGVVIGSSPHFPGQDGQAFMVSRSGYYVYKCYNTLDNSPGKTQSFDKPIFAIEEVMLNYAEAKFELSAFDQGVADKTINKLRPRAKVAKMVVSDIDGAFDPSRDTRVDPVLWEIRRERLTELFGEGFGFYDIRRWKVADWFINKKQVGAWVKKSEIGTSSIKIDGGGTEGYIYIGPEPKGWKNTYYLYPIPRQELVLNKKLVQNSGWELL